MGEATLTRHCEAKLSCVGVQAPSVLPSLTSLAPSDAWRAIGLGIGTMLWYAGFLAIPAVVYVAGIAVWSWLNAAYLVFLLSHLLWYNAWLAPPPKAALLPFAKVLFSGHCKHKTLLDSGLHSLSVSSPKF